MNAATDGTLDVFGEVTWFADAGVLPAGDYRLTNLGGCMKYSGPQDWTVHAYASGTYATWWVVDGQLNTVVMPPGTAGFVAGSGAFLNFDDCVAANQALPPLDFGFDGGQLGIKLFDQPYSDNVAGPDGGNPSWLLTRLGACQ